MRGILQCMWCVVTICVLASACQAADPPIISNIATSSAVAKAGDAITVTFTIEVPFLAPREIVCTVNNHDTTNLTLLGNIGVIYDYACEYDVKNPLEDLDGWAAISVSARSGSGPVGTGTSDSSLFIDNTNPTQPVVTLNATLSEDNTFYWTGDAHSLSASWSASDTGSGIDSYEYAIGNTSGGTEVLNWTNTEVNQANAADLDLIPGHSYYFSVKAKDAAGMYSEVGVSLPIIIDAPVPNNVIVVRNDGNDGNDGRNWWRYAKKTIQSAIDSAQPGEEVWVANGIYREHISITKSVGLYGGFLGLESSRDREWNKHPSVLQGQGTADDTIIAVTATPEMPDNDEMNTTIDGFTIQGASAAHVHDTYGCGIRFEVPAGTVLNPDESSSHYNLTITHNTFSHNARSIRSNVFDNSTIVVAYNIFDHDNSGFGGGGAVGCGDTDNSQGSCLITGNLFKDTTGDAIVCNNYPATITNNKIVGCTGNGIVSIGDDSNTLYIANNVLNNNGGHAVRWSNCLFGNAIIRNNTITGNADAGIYISNEYDMFAAPVIENNIIAYNAKGIEQPASYIVNVGNNCVVGNSQYDFGSGILGYNTVDEDPCLAPDNIHIQPNSPCINAGNPLTELLASENDIDGQGRPNPINGIDIGADDASGSTWYTLTINSSRTATVGNSVNVTAEVKDANGAYVPNVTVSFSRLDGGPISPSSISTGSTGGPVISSFTASKPAEVIVNAEINLLQGEVINASKTIGISDPAKEPWPMFQKDVAHTGEVTAQMTPGTVSEILSMAANPNEDMNNPEIFWSSPVVAYGRVYVGANDLDGTLYSIRTNGNEPRCVRLGSPILGSPTVAYGNIYVCTKQYAMCVLDAKTLEMRTSYFSMGESTFTPLVWDMQLYGLLPSIDLVTRKFHGSMPSNTLYPGLNYLGVRGAAAVDVDFPDGPRAYVADFGPGLLMADAHAADWIPFGGGEGSYSSPSLYCITPNHFLLIGEEQGELSRYSDNGMTGVSFTTQGAVRATAAVLCSAGKVYFGDKAGMAYCLDINAIGTPTAEIWETNMQSPITSSAIVSSVSNRVIFATEDGKVHALDSVTGSEVWSYQLSGTIKSSPAFADGSIFIVSGDTSGRTLYRIDP